MRTLAREYYISFVNLDSVKRVTIRDSIKMPKGIFRYLLRKQTDSRYVVILVMYGNHSMFHACGNLFV